MTIDQTQRITGVSPVPGASDTGETPVVRIARLEPDPSTRPDSLPAAVLNSLTRPIYFPLSWGVLPSFMATLLTLGILPVLLLPRWLKGVIAQHEQQLWHLAEWLRLNTGESLAIDLQSKSKEFQNICKMELIENIGFGAAAGFAILIASSSSDPRSIFSTAFSFPHSPAAVGFNGMMILIAAFNWVHITAHQRNMRNYLTVFNDLAPRLSTERIPIPKLDLGLTPLWILAGLALCAGGALWPLPVMLMMGAHRKYTMLTSIRIRAQLADRMRSILKAQQPPIRVPEKPMTILRLCPRRNCRSSLNFESTFCPRCGMRVADKVNVVA